MTDKANENTTPAVTGDVNNIPWPRDDFGFISSLRAAIRDAVQKTRGHPAKVALVSETLKVGYLYSKARGDVLYNGMYLEAIKRAAVEEAAAKDTANAGA